MAQLMPMLDAVSVAPRSTDTFASANPAMRAVEQVLAEVARLQTPILLMGEKGTGKRTLAQRIHEASPRSNQLFRRIACGDAVPSHFDGEESGDDLWATGTLYLEDFGALSQACQDRLMENLCSMGKDAPRSISSSSHSVDAEVAAGRFREDLFFRLNGISLHLPPLRQRPEDVVLLANDYLKSAAVKAGKSPSRLSEWGERCVQDYSWPGNLPELERMMFAVVASGDEKQALAEIQVRGRAGALPPISLKEAARAASREAEKELILNVLQKTRWNRRKAAEYLQISYKALLYKVKQIGVEESTKQ